MRRSKLRKVARAKQGRGVTARVAAGPITDTLRGRVYRADYGTCVYCGTGEDLSVDHVVPVSRGGKTSFENSVTACRRCNSRKGARSAREAGLELRWGRYFKPDLGRYQWLMKWIGRMRGVPERIMIARAREAGMERLEFAWIYAKHRNWSLEHAMQYLMSAYREEMT